MGTLPRVPIAGRLHTKRSPLRSPSPNQQYRIVVRQDLLDKESHDHETINQKPDASCWVCQQCGKDCKLKSALLRHVKQECPVEYRCDLCNQVFKKKSHYLKHAERSAHTCERCGKKFCWKETLKRHQKLECVHAYWCGGCHRAFPLESLLVAHAEHGCDAVRIKSPST